MAKVIEWWRQRAGGKPVGRETPDGKKHPARPMAACSVPNTFAQALAHQRLRDQGARCARCKKLGARGDWPLCSACWFLEFEAMLPTRTRQQALRAMRLKWRRAK